MSVGVPRRVRSLLIVALLCGLSYFFLLPRFGYVRDNVPLRDDAASGVGVPAVGIIVDEVVDPPHSVDTPDTVDPIPPPDDWRAADVEKRDAVVDAFMHAWSAYERDAMGYDEYHPLSHKGENLGQNSGGIGYTVIDVLDTMFLMSPSSPAYQRARTWVEQDLTFDRNGEFNVFETTIRVLGGLLSLYHLTSDTLYLTKATDLADRILPAFTSSSGLPFPSINLAQRKGVPDHYSPSLISTAEASSLQLEFRYLAHLTGTDEFWYKAEKVMKVIDDQLPIHGKFLVPIFMNLDKGTFMKSDVRLGSRGDSYYEYLLKQYLQTNQTEKIYKQMYEEAVDSIHTHIVKQTPRRKTTYLAELVSQGDSFHISNKQDHLVCFFAGTLLLGATTLGLVPGLTRASVPPNIVTELTSKGKRDWTTGIELLEGCWRTHETQTGLSPEIVQFGENPTGDESVEREWFISNSKKGGPSGYDARYMLRPETVESIFYAYRLTGDTKYRSWAWHIFQSIERYARIPEGGYATIKDVDTVPAEWEDKQETFLMSETFKYLWLTFEDQGVVDLNENVLNTEAHPLPVFIPSIKPQFIS